MVRHTTDGAPVVRFSISYLGLFAAAAVTFSLLVFGTVFFYSNYRDNQRLEQRHSELSALNVKQSREIRRLSEAAITYNSTIKTFVAKYGQIATSYVSKNQGGANCTSAKDCVTLTPNAGDGSQLQMALRDLQKVDSSSGAGGGSIGKIEKRLTSYLSSVPSAWPAKGSVSSLYGGRADPFSGSASFHPGLDITAPYGEKVTAAGGGVVAFAGNDGDGFGNEVVIDHGDQISTLYGHMSEILVKKGEEIERGGLIGRVGSTGRSTGNHLHFEILVDGTPTNPLAYIASPK